MSQRCMRMQPWLAAVPIEEAVKALVEGGDRCVDVALQNAAHAKTAGGEAAQEWFVGGQYR